MWLYFLEPGCGFSVLLFGSLRKMHIWPKKKIPQVILSAHKLQQLCKRTLKSSRQKTKAAGRRFHTPLPKEVEEKHDAPVDRGRCSQKPTERLGAAFILVWWHSLLILLQPACWSPSPHPSPFLGESASWCRCEVTFALSYWMPRPSLVAHCHSFMMFRATRSHHLRYKR